MKSNETNPIGDPDNVEHRSTEGTQQEITEIIERTNEEPSKIRRVWQDLADRYIHRGIQPKKVTPSLFEDIQNAVAEGGGRLLRVDPYPENESIAASEALFQELHDARMKWFNLVNTSETHGFEIWFNDGKLSFYFYVRSERAEKKFKKQIDAYYPNAKIVPIHGNTRRSLPSNSEDTNNKDNTPTHAWWDDRFIPIYNGDYVAAAELRKKLNYFYPIRSSKGIVPMKEDPYKAITSEILSDDLDRTMIQVVFRPARKNWEKGKIGSSIIPNRLSASEIAESLKKEKLHNTITGDLRQPTQEEIQLSEKIMAYSRRKAFQVNIRVISFSPYKEEAGQNVWSLSTAFERSYEESAGDSKTQSLKMQPASGKNIDSLVKQCARRKWEDCNTVLTVPELASVAHIPNENIETPAITWNQTGKGSRPPADMPRFNEPPKRLPPGIQRKTQTTKSHDSESKSPPEEQDASNDQQVETKSVSTDTESPTGENQQPTHDDTTEIEDNHDKQQEEEPESIIGESLASLTEEPEDTWENPFHKTGEEPNSEENVTGERNEPVNNNEQTNGNETEPSPPPNPGKTTSDKDTTAYKKNIDFGGSNTNNENKQES